MSARRGLRNFAATGALCLASILSTLGLGEFIVRVFDVGPTFQIVYRDLFELDPNPQLRYRLRPGAPDGSVAINSAGFRGRDYAAAKLEGVFRVVAIGDSVTFGSTVGRDDSWPAHLERLLNARAAPGAPRFEVLNLGVTGYNITQAAERLRVLGMAFHPDLVLYGYVLNDPQEFSVEAQALLDRRDFALRSLRERIGRGMARSLAWSRLFLLARHRLIGETGLPEFERDRPLVDPGYVAVRSGDARGDYFLALHRDNAPLRRLDDGMEALRETATGVPVAVAIFPLFLDFPGGTYGLAEAHARAAAAARARGFHVLDLQPAFAAACPGLGERRCVSDFMHPSATGNRVAATAVLLDLAASGLLPRGSLRADSAPAGDPLDAAIALSLAAGR